MFYLMRLELKKINIKTYIVNFILMIVIVMGLVTAMALVSVYGDDKEINDVFHSYREMTIMVGVLIRAAILVFSSVLLNRIALAEYKERTVLQLFTYPVPRKKIYASKLMIIFLFSLIATLLTSTIGNSYLLVLNQLANLFPDGSVSTLITSMKDCLIGAGMCGFISLIPFYFGMRKKSQATTIISAVIIAALLSNSIGSISDSRYMLRLLIIGGLSILAVIYTICVKLNQLENIDL